MNLRASAQELLDALEEVGVIATEARLERTYEAIKTLRHAIAEDAAKGSVTLAERVCELAARYKGLRAAARATDVDAGYLHRLKGGSRTQPSDDVLRKLGLRKVVRYVRRPMLKAAKEEKPE